MKLDLIDSRRFRSLGVRCALALAAPLAFLTPSVASADNTVVVQNQGGPRGDSDHYVPNWYALSSGLAVWGATYTASVVVAASSSHTGDNYLYIPVVGPWVDMANRCGGASKCDDDVGNKALLALDGVFQGLGTLSIISSFFMPVHHTRAAVATAKANPFTIHVTPASYGRGTPGLALTGTF